MTLSSDAFHLPRPFGPYTLLRRIAVGGMAEVYVAKARGLGGFEKLVAIKVIHPRYSEDQNFIRMLVEEAKISVLLTHTNVGQIFDLGCIDNTYFIVMEYIEGADTYRVMKRAADSDVALPFDICAFIASEMCNGLDYAHRKRDLLGHPLGIVHRDISPQNVLVSYAGEVKIVDFGIAKAALRSGQTDAGVIKGKYYYMSPEQAWGDATDHRSDIFSTGVVLYELLTGEMLYHEDNVPLLLEKVRKASIVSPQVKRPEIPDELAAIVMKALERRVDDRYQSAMEMGQALSRFLYDNSPSFAAAHIAELMTRLFEEELKKSAALRGSVMEPLAEVSDEPHDPSFDTESLAPMQRDEFARDPTKSVIFDILADDEGPTYSEHERTTRERSLLSIPSAGRGLVRDPSTSPKIPAHESRPTVRPPAFGKKRSNEDPNEPESEGPQTGPRRKRALGDSTVPLSVDSLRREPVSTQAHGRSERSDDDATDVSEMQSGSVSPIRHRGTVASTPSPSSGRRPSSSMSASPERSPAPMTSFAERQLSDAVAEDRGSSTDVVPMSNLLPQLATPALPMDLTTHWSSESSGGAGTGPKIQVPLHEAFAGEPSSSASNPWEPFRATASHPGQPVTTLDRTLDPFSAPVHKAVSINEIGSPSFRRWARIGILVAVLAAIGGLVAYIVNPGPPPPLVEVISVPPGADVRLDGRGVPGKTPVRIAKGLTVGKLHEIQVALDGYETWTTTFQPSLGLVKQIAVLAPQRAVLRVESNPPGAHIWVNGVLHGPAPLEVQHLPIGTTVELKASSVGRAEVKQRVTVTAENLHPHILIVLPSN